MIRFCDLRAAYWLDLIDEPKGPIAFINTVTDTFIDVGGYLLFDDFAHLLECMARDLASGSIDMARCDRICGLVPEAMR